MVPTFFTSSSIAHISVGDFELGLTASILIGALPAVYVGARMSAIAPDGVIRPALVIVLLASALKLLDVPTQIVGLALVVVALVGFPLWGAVDASSFPEALWALIERDRTEWIRKLLFLAPVGIGFGYAVVYFAKIRPKLVALVASPERIVVPTVAAS